MEIGGEKVGDEDGKHGGGEERGERDRERSLSERERGVREGERESRGWRDGWTDREITAACCVQETAHSIVLLS